jgi:hypothetical protein
MRHGVDVRLDLVEKLKGFHIGDDKLARFKPFEAAIFFRHFIVQMRVFVEDVDHRQFVALGDFKIVEVVARG